MRLDPSIDIDASEGVYEPAEDSRLLIGAIETVPGERVLEVGCGSGVVALHCAKSGAAVTASDISDAALECAKRNAVGNGLQLEFVKSDLFDDVSGDFDLIVFNPPYLPNDGVNDRQLAGGRTGIEMSLRFLEQAKAHLKKGGRVLIVVSSLGDPKGFEMKSREIGFNYRKMSEKRLFFETLAVYELRLHA